MERSFTVETIDRFTSPIGAAIVTVCVQGPGKAAEEQAKPGQHDGCRCCCGTVKAEAQAAKKVAPQLPKKMALEGATSDRTERSAVRVHDSQAGWVGIVWSTENSLINTAHPSDHLESLLFFLAD